VTYINLLRWRQTENGLMQKKQQGIFSVIAMMLFFVFTVLHVILGHANRESRREWLDLKNRISIHENARLNKLPPDDNVQFEETRRAQFSQQQLSNILKLLRCLGGNRIQVTQMNFQVERTSVSGLVDSAEFLSGSLLFCSGKKNHFSIGKLNVSHSEKNALLRFSFVIM